MRFSSIRQNQIKEFLVENIEKHQNDLTKFSVEKLKISRQAVNNYAKQLEKDGVIEIVANGRNPIYKLKDIKEIFTLDITPQLSEDQIWRSRIVPKLPKLNAEVLGICNYGFTEMVNNVLDHSESLSMTIELGYNANKIWFWILYDCVGIFNKNQKHFNLDDPRHAILELHKGKLTSQPKNHSGQGIFFTSRMFDEFDIISGNIFFTGSAENDFMSDTTRHFSGTAVYMRINRNSTKTQRQIFDQYSDDELGFTKTMIPVKLMQYEGEILVSRSQAKRLISRFEKFKEVILDFKDVVTIGQAFADQIFRIFTLDNPNVHLIPINASEEITKMINYTKNNINIPESYIVSPMASITPISAINQTSSTSSVGTNTFKKIDDNAEPK